MEKTYLERVKTEFVFDPELKQPITERTRKLRDEMLFTTPRICTDRAVLYTESWKETEGQPLIQRRAKAFKKVLEEMPILIRPGELIVGCLAKEVRAAPVFPEFSVNYLKEELDEDLTGLMKGQAINTGSRKRMKK